MGEPDPESEAMLPVEIQKKGTKRAERSLLKGLLVALRGINGFQFRQIRGMIN